MLRRLRRKVVESGLLPADEPEPAYAVCAREQVTGDLPPETLVMTAADIF